MVDHSMHNMVDSSTPANNMGQMDHSMMMKMYFNVDLTVYLLFKPWRIHSVPTMVAACFGIFVLAALYEGLKVLREQLLTRSTILQRSGYEMSNGHPITEGEPPMEHVAYPATRRIHLLSWSHLLQSVLHMVQVVISYFLMLVFMTYNVYLCIAVVLGAGVGYFAFGWKRSIVVDINEHCH